MRQINFGSSSALLFSSLCILIAFHANGQPVEETVPVDSVVVPEPVKLQKTIEASPDVAELIIDVNENSPGFLANHYQYQFTLGADPLINGRLALGFQLKLNERYSVDIFLAGENYRLGQYLLQFSTPQHLTKVFLQWEVLLGAGCKIRVSEWLLKTSLFVEPTLSIGYYEQEFNHETYNSARIRPGFYLGLETILDSGIVISSKIGAEYPIDIALKKDGMAVPGLFSMVPVLSAGYAW